MGKGAVIFGVLLLIVGIFIALAYIPLTVKSAAQAKEYLKEKSAKNETVDYIKFYGEITAMEKMDLSPYGGPVYYMYEVNGDGQIKVAGPNITEEDMIFPYGDAGLSKGEAVIVEVWIPSDNTTMPTTAVHKMTFYYMVGGAIAFVGIIIIAVGARKKKQPVPPQQQQYPQPPR